MAPSWDYVQWDCHGTEIGLPFVERSGYMAPSWLNGTVADIHGTTQVNSILILTWNVQDNYMVLPWPGAMSVHYTDMGILEYC